MIELLLIGIGTGNPDHLTLEAIKALKSADLVLVPLKGDEKSDLADVRRAILAAHISGASTRVTEFAMPLRDRDDPDYRRGVDLWHDAIASVWKDAITRALPTKAGRVALLVWGDPSLYDSTLRIAERLKSTSTIGSVRVIPGLTSIQLLTSAHGIALNEIGENVVVTTGRKLAKHGWPDGADTIVVMLDGRCAFTSLLREDISACETSIWWGAYLGLPQQITINGQLADVAEQIVETRRAARTRHGWIMDTYLLRRRSQAEG